MEDLYITENDEATQILNRIRIPEHIKALVGQPYTDENLRMIQDEGLSASQSCKDGTIARIIIPVYPKVKE